MATTRDWGDSSYLKAQAPGPATFYFADGDAASYVVHTAPAWAGGGFITNESTTSDLYVSFRGRAAPASGSAAARATTDLCARLEPGDTLEFSFVDDQGNAHPDATTPPRFSTFGEQGAAHPMRGAFSQAG